MKRTAVYRHIQINIILVKQKHPEPKSLTVVTLIICVVARGDVSDTRANSKLRCISLIMCPKLTENGVNGAFLYWSL